MKVCAHAKVANQSNYHFKADSVAEAIRQYRSDVEDLYTGPEVGGERGAMFLYPQCSDCDWGMNFHDYPMSCYAVGPRGGLKREYV